MGSRRSLTFAEVQSRCGTRAMNRTLRRLVLLTAVCLCVTSTMTHSQGARQAEPASIPSTHAKVILPNAPAPLASQRQVSPAPLVATPDLQLAPNGAGSAASHRLLAATDLRGQPSTQSRLGPKSVKLSFFGFTEEASASKECGLDEARLRNMMQTVLDAAGLTVPSGENGEATMVVQLGSSRQGDLCVTLMEVGLQAEGTVTLAFNGTPDTRAVILQMCAGVSVNPNADPAAHAKAVEGHLNDLVTKVTRQWRESPATRAAEGARTSLAIKCDDPRLMEDGPWGQPSSRGH